MAEILPERARQVYRNGEHSHRMECEKQSASGSVSQRACVFCGSRVVLYPIADALHIVHGPIGCASYTCTFAARYLPDLSYTGSVSPPTFANSMWLWGEKRSFMQP